MDAAAHICAAQRATARMIAAIFRFIVWLPPLSHWFCPWRLRLKSTLSRAARQAICNETRDFCHELQIVGDASS
jgi:hypothetical protein